MDVEVEWSHVLLLAWSGGSLIENHVKHIVALGQLTALALRASVRLAGPVAFIYKEQPNHILAVHWILVEGKRKHPNYYGGNLMKLRQAVLSLQCWNRNSDCVI